MLIRKIIEAAHELRHAPSAGLPLATLETISMAKIAQIHGQTRHTHRNII